MSETDETLDEELDEETEDQQVNSKVPPQLRPFQYKKGQSGNPSGRPEGISMKEYIRVKFRTMTDEERENFLEGMSKKDILEMGEGKPKQDMDVRGTISISQVLDELENGGSTS